MGSDSRSITNFCDQMQNNGLIFNSITEDNSKIIFIRLFESNLKPFRIILQVVFFEKAEEPNSTDIASLKIYLSISAGLFALIFVTALIVYFVYKHRSSNH